VNPPASAGVDPVSGVFAWTPSSGQVGSFTITARVSDGHVAVDRTFTVTVQRRATTAAYVAPVTGQYSDPVTLTAVLTDTTTLGGIPSLPMTLKVGGVTGSATTGAGGTASALVWLTEPAGAKTASASFAGNAAYLPSTDSKAFTVTKEDAVVRFTGRSLTLTTGTTSPVVLTATVTEAADGTLGNALAGVPVTFRNLDGSVLCTATVPSPVAAGTGTASCTTAALPLGSRALVVTMSSPTYVARADVGVVVVAQAAAGTASGGGRVTDPGDSSKADFGFRAVPQRKGAPLGEVVQVYRTGTTASVLRSATLGALTTSCSTTKPRACTATLTASAMTQTTVDLTSGATASVAGTSAATVWATDAAEPSTTLPVPPDRYAVATTGAVPRSLGSSGSQQLLELGNVRIP